MSNEKKEQPNDDLLNKLTNKAFEADANYILLSARVMALTELCTIVWEKQGIRTQKNGTIGESLGLMEREYVETLLSNNSDHSPAYTGALRRYIGQIWKEDSREHE